jgi:anti-sigma B factor antagonist
MSQLLIGRQRKDGVLILRLEGYLSLGPAVNTLTAVAGEALAEDPPPGIVINLAKVERIDSAGLGELLIISTRAAEKRTVMAVCCATQRVRDLLRVTRMDAMLAVYADESQAVDALKGEEHP